MMRRKKRRKVEKMMKYQTNTIFHLRDAQDALSLRQVECGFLTPSKVNFLCSVCKGSNLHVVIFSHRCSYCPPTSISSDVYLQILRCGLLTHGLFAGSLCFTVCCCYSISLEGKQGAKRFKVLQYESQDG